VGAAQSTANLAVETDDDVLAINPNLSDDSDDADVPQVPSLEPDGDGFSLSMSVSTVEDMEATELEAIVPSSPATGNEIAADGNAVEQHLEAHLDNTGEGESWETVEVRVRGNRKKPAERYSSSGQRHPIHLVTSMGAYTHDSHSGKKLRSPRVVTPKKKVMSKRIVRDILFSLLDSVEEESRRRKQALPAPPRATNSWKNGPPVARSQGLALRRDFATCVSGSDEKVAPKAFIADQPAVDSAKSTRATSLEEKVSKQLRETWETPRSLQSQKDEDNIVSKMSPLGKQGKTYAGILADQNTAPTYQETVSSSSNARFGSKENPPNSEDPKSDSSSLADTAEELPQIRHGEVQSKVDSNVASTPPLPTLLSPENANSATSSVASSLDAPHAGRIHHHSVAATGVNDVGYHLLDVCDRLSRDMSLFMSRRALALSARRRERGAILAALQDSVSSIWPRRCHVELYGSCATQLDLPSSDIDVVVLGLDRPDSIFRGSSDSVGTNLSMDDASPTEEVQRQQHFPPATFGMIPMHRNAERILRLAADLEGQPWAVQVNAIPTASVPVVKVLADPSKLTSNGGEWMAQHQYMAAQVAAAAGKCQPLGSRSHLDYPITDHSSYPHPTHLPWRGSDVMKGLLSLDITFEGPEHGGIGSTEFSSRIVLEACAESGLHPDATPFVQVLMVLKELLCQRKLNEPYSGGLSSYALLLLVLALVRERAVIREEIELVEQQKRAMAFADPSAFCTAQCDDYLTNTADSAAQFFPSNSCLMNGPTVHSRSDSPKKQGIAIPSTADVAATQTNQLQKNTVDNTSPSKDADGTQTERRNSPKPVNPTPQSWASVAKTSVMPKKPISTGYPGLSKEVAKEPTLTSKPAAKPSFAEALKRSTNGVSKLTHGKTPIEQKIPSATGKGQREGSVALDTAPRLDEVSRKKTPPIVLTTTTSNPSTHDEPVRVAPEVSPLGDASLRIAPAFYPQGYNDIVEVLCSGETTAGKLLMHFLLFYGQHFDAQSTAIDVSGKHERDFTGQSPPFSYLSPYIQRRARGIIDPITGMLTVDPIVIYDPLEGAENNNVARRCFAWNSVRWIFAQSYATLASAVERSATPPSTPGGNSVPASPLRDSRERQAISAAFNSEAIRDLSDPTSPLLKCLLSF
jgi:hypothetical protein